MMKKGGFTLLCHCFNLFKHPQKLRVYGERKMALNKTGHLYDTTEEQSLFRALDRRVQKRRPSEYCYRISTSTKARWQ
jgi:hypothetical protein